VKVSATLGVGMADGAIRSRKLLSALVGLVPALNSSTLLAPSRLARALDMVVQPVVAEVLPRGEGYRVRFLEPFTDYPSDDALADTLRMNQWIEHEVRQLPEQYLWVHKRFKTRPKREPSLY